MRTNCIKPRDPYYKPSFYIMPYGGLDKVPPTRHFITTCCSEFNRYPEQTNYIKGMMSDSKRTRPLKLLNIGVSQGQEPLTHIKSAYELSQTFAKKISDYLDLTTVDILRFPPELPDEAQTLDINIVKHLQDIYSCPEKSFWSMPIENFVDRLTQNGEKKDVILFNNVIQHMSADNEKKLPEFFRKLADLIAPNGILCSALVKRDHSQLVIDRYKNMLDTLKAKNFVEIISGIFKKTL